MSATARRKLLNPKEASDLTRKPTGTLANWRGRDYGPPYVKLGHSIRYFEDDLLAWLEARRVVPDEEQA